VPFPRPRSNVTSSAMPSWTAGPNRAAVMPESELLSPYATYRQCTRRIGWITWAWCPTIRSIAFDAVSRRARVVCSAVGE
jgi:hypothetical protein